MTLGEAILQVESWFNVHHDAGYQEVYTDQDGKVVGEGGRDMTCAPCGIPYLVLTSGGVWEHGDAPDVLFRNADRAASFWALEIEDYAETIGPRDTWSSLHLYWRTKPEFVAATYLLMDQAEMLRRASPMSGMLQVELGWVTSELVISKLDPDGKAEPIT